MTMSQNPISFMGVSSSNTVKNNLEMCGRIAGKPRIREIEWKTKYDHHASSDFSGIILLSFKLLFNLYLAVFINYIF